MKRLIGFLFLFLSIGIYAKENIIRIQEVSGQVEINGGGKNIPPAVNSYLPSNSEIKIKASGKLEISINEEIFIIKGPIELNLAKIHSMRNMTKTITFTASVRGLQNDILNQIEEKSEEAYGEYVRSHNGALKDHNEWKPILEKVFTRLMDASSREAFKLKYSILQDKEFNAAAFPGGQFVIHTATLDRIDLESKKNAGNDDKAYKSNRENYAAGVIAHELAHYYNNHTLQKVKKIISFNEEKKESYEVVLLEEVKFSQDLELDADSSGLILLQKAGYEASARIDMLEILNKVHQEAAKLQKTQIPFFASHPTPHDRLKVFEGSKRICIHGLLKWKKHLRISN
ncbi:MAG: M48 family metallopeptidase [Leptospiraceae bacterium]|nr:M48 family metallopeptidase [Leptospiraceae bacterium]